MNKVARKSIMKKGFDASPVVGYANEHRKGLPVFFNNGVWRQLFGCNQTITMGKVR